MANPEHLTILKQGVEAWNAWREQNPGIRPDLEGANLQRANLQGADLQEANLRGANLFGAKLLVANLRKADLRGAKLKGAKLQGANLHGANLRRADLRGADLRGANLGEANLRWADLQGANLRGANLWKAKLKGADLQKADLKEVDLRKAELRWAKLQKAKLRWTDLRRADMHSANLDQAQVHNVKYSRFGRYHAIRLGNCYGSQHFRRHAMDQDFIEEFRRGPKHWRFWLLYLPWLLLCDCGRSFMLWLVWCVLAAWGFAHTYVQIGQKAFHLANGLEWSFDTMLYYSTVTITTLGFGDVTPLTPQAKHWVMAEVILGYILLGGLISILATKLTRRSG